MKKKIYAAWFAGKEKEAVFFDHWDECRPYVSGVSQIRYKSFPDLETAQEFLDNPNLTKQNQRQENLDKKFISNPISKEKPIFIKNGYPDAIYVDGSFGETSRNAGWAWVAITHNREHKEGILHEESGMTSHPATSRNVDGEIEAVLRAVTWLKNYLATSLNSSQSSLLEQPIPLYYDYHGIKHWALGNWKTNIELTRNYRTTIKPFLPLISFKKVKSHSGDYWNNYVDRLAKKAIKE